MMKNEATERISYLIFKYITNSISEEEQKELSEWCHQSDSNMKLFERLTDKDSLEKEYMRWSAVNSSRPQAEMEKRIGVARRKSNKGWFLVASSVAAVLILLLFLKQSPDNNSQKGVDVVTNNSQQTVTAFNEVTEIKPGETKATLITEVGDSIDLSAADGVNAKKIVESKSSTLSIAPTQRKLSLDVPRGGEFKIVLEDSTEVWLNSESKLTYPESFLANERRVSVTGEAYFKVAKDDRPFYVDTEGQVVRVYGTEFNIRSYPEDTDIYTTLVSGRISLFKENMESSELLLSPGNQALFNKNSSHTSIKSVNTDVVTSWRDGRFVFQDQNLLQIMRDLSRWYSFDFSFDDKELEKIVFMGSLPRYSEFDTVLAILEKSGGLTFTLNGSNVIISTKP